MTFDEARIKREVLYRIADAKGLLDHQRSEAQQILRRLLDQPLQFEAFEHEGEKKGYKVTGKGSYLQLLPSPFVSPCVVSPRGKAGMYPLSLSTSSFRFQGNHVGRVTQLSFSVADEESAAPIEMAAHCRMFLASPLPTQLRSEPSLLAAADLTNRPDYPER